VAGSNNIFLRIVLRVHFGVDVVKLAGFVVELFEAVEAGPIFTRQDGAQMLAIGEEIYGQQIYGLCSWSWPDKTGNFRWEKYGNFVPESGPVLDANAAFLMEDANDLPNFEVTNAGCF
jgi:hypothetical protein